jgi:hypothetical protein
MVAHNRSRGPWGRLTSTIVAFGAIGILSFASACDKVPLLAPTGTVITILPAATNVPLNGQVELVVTVIENGTTATPPPTTGTPAATTSSPGAGTPVQNGTLVSFTSTIGRIEPAEARTQNGQVRVRFISSGTSGTARITAFSGGASGTLDNLLVGTAAAARIIVTATQQTLGSNGGSTEILARVEDTAGTALPGVPVTFTTNAGTVNPTSTVTDSSGIARTTLTTSTAAVVTAAAGAQTGNVTVAVTPNLGLSLQATPNPASTGVPVTFTIATAATGVARDAVIAYGDGTQDALGTVSGTTSRAHSYAAPGTYTATVSATDAGGTRQSQAVSVIVGALPVSITPTPATATVGTPVTFTANTGTTAVPASRYVWTYDDGTVQTTSGNSTSRVFPTRGTKTVRVDIFGVNGNQIGTATTQMNIT